MIVPRLNPGPANRNRARTARLAVFGLVLAAAFIPVRAQDGPDAGQRQRKAAEIDRLRHELSRAEAELRELERAAPAPDALDRPAPSPPAAEPGASSAPADLAGKTGAPLDVAALVAQFQANPDEANRRYRKQTLTLEARVDRFAPKFARRAYDVILASPDPRITVVASFNYLEGFKAVYTTHDGRILEARTDRSRFPLLEIGDRIRLQTRVEGFKQGRLRLGRCAVVSTLPR